MASGRMATHTARTQPTPECSSMRMKRLKLEMDRLKSKRSVSGPAQAAARVLSSGCQFQGKSSANAPCRMIGDAGEQVGDIVLRVESVELGALDYRIDRRGAATAGIEASEQIILAANGDAAQSAFGRIVIESRRPSSKPRASAVQRARNIAKGPGELGFARELAHGALGPSGQCLGNRFEWSWRCCRRRSGGDPLIVFSTA